MFHFNRNFRNLLVNGKRPKCVKKERDKGLSIRLATRRNMQDLFRILKKYFFCLNHENNARNSRIFTSGVVWVFNCSFSLLFFFSCIILTFIFYQRLTVETQADCPNDFRKTESIPLPLFYLFTGTNFPDI